MKVCQNRRALLLCLHRRRCYFVASRLRDYRHSQ